MLCIITNSIPPPPLLALSLLQCRCMYLKYIILLILDDLMLQKVEMQYSCFPVATQYNMKQNMGGFRVQLNYFVYSAACINS